MAQLNVMYDLTGEKIFEFCAERWDKFQYNWLYRKVIFVKKAIQKQVFNSGYLRGNIIPKPKNFKKMVEIAEKLSKGFPELRVDLYNIDGKIYFGELTFTSQGGFMDYFTLEFNKMLGEKFCIKDFLLKRK